MRGGKIGKKYKKTESGRIETVGDFSVRVVPYLCKRLKNDDDVHGTCYRACFESN